MKKVLCLIMTAIIMITCIAAVSATEKNDVLAAIKAAVPAEIYNAYYVQAENVLNQVDLTSEMADSLIAIVNDVKSNVKLDKSSVSAYVGADRDYLIGKLNDACDIMGVVATVDSKSDKASDGVIVISDKAGKKLAEFGSDPVKTTNAPAQNVISEVAPFAAIALIALAGVTVVAGKKQLSK